MPDSFVLRVPDDDLVAVRAAHKRLLRHFNGDALSVEMLALIALRSVDPEFLADEVLSVVARKSTAPLPTAVAG